MGFARLLTSQMRAQRISASALGDTLGVSTRTVQLWMSGSVLPKAPTVPALLEHTGLTAGQILGASDPVALAARAWCRASADEFRAARVGAGFTQGRLAETANVSKVSISRWESGTMFPQPALLTSAVEALGIDSATVIGWAHRYVDGAVRERPQFSVRLLQWRTGVGLSQAGAAQRLGVDSYAYGLWETGLLFPPPDARIRLVDEGAFRPAELAQLMPVEGLSLRAQSGQLTPLSDALLDLARAHDGSIANAAKILDVAPSTVGSWIAGTRAPSKRSVTRVAQVTGRPVHTLLPGPPDPPRSYAEAITNAMSRGAWTREALAAELYVHPNWVGLCRAGRILPTRSLREALCQVLGLVAEDMEILAAQWVPYASPTGKLLAAYRAEHRLLQRDLAKMLGLNPRSVSDLERGLWDPSPALAAHIAARLAPAEIAVAA